MKEPQFSVVNNKQEQKCYVLELLSQSIFLCDYGTAASYTAVRG